MGQPLHLRGCLLLAAASYGAAPDARARSRLRGPARAANASSALARHASRQPGGLSNDAPPPRPLANDSRALSLIFLSDDMIPADDDASSGNDYAQLAKLVASDAAAGDYFGYFVAIDGDTVVVGAYCDDDDGSCSGSTYVFRTTDGGATYVEVAKLTASDATMNDLFGCAVAIDGNTVVVGAWGDDDAGSGSGSAYVFRTSDGGATYVEVAKLTASDAAASDMFGYSVAIDGATIVVAAYAKDMDTGAVYVFRTTDGGATYGQVAKLTASDGAYYDNFGTSVAIAGGTVAVGADQRWNGGSGSVYVFRTTDGGVTYPQVDKLTASDGAAGDEFGYSVAFDGSTLLVVGARGDGGSSSGSAYVFRTTDGGATYGQVAKLTASDAASNDYFGYSVAIYGGTVVVGASRDDDGGSASGSVYVFHTSDGGATYDQLAKFTASDAAASDNFGTSVAIDGATVVVAAELDDDAGDKSGSAYVFALPAPTDYAETAKLTASDAAYDDEFAGSVAIDGDTIVVGAHDDDDACTGPLAYMCQSGSAYVFRTTDGGVSYGQVAKLTASDAALSDAFGISVAIAGGTIVVGAHIENSGRGAAYFFRTSDGGVSYGQVAKLIAADGAGYDMFGYSVAIDGDTVVVGAYSDDSDRGSAYVFRTSNGGSTYGQVTKLTADDAAADDRFGWSVAISGDTVVIGSCKSGSSGTCKAYVFRTTDGGATYGQVAKLTASDAAASDGFGISVAIAGDTVVVGAEGDDYSGSAYVFSPPTLDESSAPQPSTAALGSDSATRAGGTLATALLALAATALAL